MTGTITPLPNVDHGDCNGCDYAIRAAVERGEKPAPRGRSTWKFDRGGGKIYWLCVNCACRSAHTHGVACAMNPDGIKSITLSIPVTIRQ